MNNKYTFRKGLYLSGGSFDHVGELPQILEQKYPEIYRFINEITLIDDYFARKLEKLEAKVFTRIFEPRLDKKLMSILNQVYDINAEGLTNLSVSPSQENYYVLTFLTPKAAIHLDELGDGAKYATVILFLCFLLKNSALLIEEIESHQHIGAIRKLLPYLLQISNERNVQLFLTTHSFEVIQELSRLSEKFDIRFSHIQRDEGEITIRQIPSPDVKLLLDLGVDLRNLDFYKKFIVVEGESDVIFIRSLLEKYSKNVDGNRPLN